MSIEASSGSLCYECSSKVADYWCDDCKCDMCKECCIKVHHGRKLSQHQRMPIEQKPESCEDHTRKKRKNDTSVLIDDVVLDINKDEQLAKAEACLKDKEDKRNALVDDNGNINLRQITTTFDKLREMINKREETLKTQVRSSEQKNTSSTEEDLKSNESKQQSLSSETALPPSKKIDYCIDAIDQLETKIKDVLDQTCITEFPAPGTYTQLKCRGRPCLKCGKCRDWYYTGDVNTWRWIISVDDWDEEEREQWDDKKCSDRFKRRKGYTCKGSYGHYYDRNRNYHGVHISTYRHCDCGEGYNTLIQHGNMGCGRRYQFIGQVLDYCQCLENIKAIS